MGLDRTGFLKRLNEYAPGCFVERNDPKNDLAIYLVGSFVSDAPAMIGRHYYGVRVSQSAVWQDSDNAHVPTKEWKKHIGSEWCWQIPEIVAEAREHAPAERTAHEKAIKWEARKTVVKAACGVQTKRAAFLLRRAGLDVTHDDKILGLKLPNSGIDVGATFQEKDGQSDTEINAPVEIEVVSLIFVADDSQQYGPENRGSVEDFVSLVLHLAAWKPQKGPCP
jgi:hypothetical protein